MTIAILKLEAGQKIARPFNRACSISEMAECIGYWQAVKQNTSRDKAQAFMTFCGQNASVILKVANIDTETPVAEIHGAKFYAFTEE